MNEKRVKRMLRELRDPNAASAPAGPGFWETLGKMLQSAPPPAKTAKSANPRRRDIGIATGPHTSPGF